MWQWSEGMLNTSDGPVLTLLSVWSSPNRLGSHTTLRLNDSELHIINDLGQAGRIQEVIDGIIGVVKVLGVTIF